jgi:hypothetical protein
MQKHAYMIIAHNEFDLLEILVRLLDDPRNDIYVHIDAKVKDFDFKSFQALTQYSRLRFTPRRISATWGDFSLVNTELLLLQTAVAGEDPAQPYAYYHLEDLFGLIPNINAIAGICDKTALIKLKSKIEAITITTALIHCNSSVFLI